MTTHDYRRRFWAHDYTFDPVDAGQRGHMMGWGPDVAAGDYLILEAPNPNGTRYAVERISYFPDPPDMWEADVVFAPR